MRQGLLVLFAAVFVSGCATYLPRSATVVDFESFELPEQGFYNGSDGAAVIEFGDVAFPVEFNTEYGSWSGTAVSSLTDTETAGFTNQYSAFAGSGYDASAQFAVMNGLGVTEIRFADPSVVYGLFATNGTYAARSMMEGDQFAKKFTFEDEDYFRVTFTGLDSAERETGSVDLMLGDFRSRDPEVNSVIADCGSPIRDCWTLVDLSDLGAVSKLVVSFESSDVGDYGMNTPAYVVIDNLAYEAVE